MHIEKLKVGPVIKIIEEDLIVIWGELKKVSNKIPIFAIRILKSGIICTKYVLVEKDTMIARIVIDDLGKYSYFYQVTAVYLNSIDDLRTIDTIIQMENIWRNSILYSLDLSNDNYSLIFGSCRRYVSIFGIPLFGTGKEGDKIYKTIKNLNPKLFLSIGDQVYYDAIGSFNRIKSKKSMIKLNRKMRSYSHIKNLMSNVLTAEICDDHDIHCNNTNSIIQYNDKNTFNNGLDTYYRYQHYSGYRNDPLWYTFRKELKYYDISFFVMDTRTERNDMTNIKTIISDYQMSCIKNWIQKEEDSIKFLVSSCPVLSQTSNDSWFGYPEQQKELINIISMEKNVFILTGDAHCARIGVYEVSNLVSSIDPSINKCMITEILSSGLVAVNHDMGYGYNILESNIYDIPLDGDFPLIIDNTKSGGLLAKTLFATKSYPNPHKVTGFNKIKNIFTRVVDNVFIRINFFETYLKAEIMNQDGDILHFDELLLS